MQSFEATDTRHILVIYTDRALLTVLGRPKMLGQAADGCVELAERSRLDTRKGHAESGHAALPAPPVDSPREAWSSAMARADRIRGASDAATVGLVCHLDDLDALLPHMRSVDDVRLLWHPSDIAGADVEDTLRRLEGSVVAEAIGPHPTYFAAQGRDVCAEDWLRAVNCPVLQMFADTARRRRHRLMEQAVYSQPLSSPTAPNHGRPHLSLVAVPG